MSDPAKKGCPNCGATAHRKEKPQSFVAFKYDRLCKQCGTRYTPPTPIWARILFGIVGIPCIIMACVLLYAMLAEPQKFAPLVLWIGVMALCCSVGFACLSQAFFGRSTEQDALSKRMFGTRNSSPEAVSNTQNQSEPRTPSDFSSIPKFPGG
jgi:hypothetical protein